MGVLDMLRVPLVAAPMSGGPSTPRLVAAVGEAGALGFLAGAHLSPVALHRQIVRVRSASGRPFGVNLTLPEGDRDPDRTWPAWRAYRAALVDDAVRVGVTLPLTPARGRDLLAAKLSVVLEERPAVVSFTFGLPGGQVLRELRRAGIAVWSTVSCPAEALEAEAAGVDAIVLQGPGAGGHRATFRAAEPPVETELGVMVDAARRITDKPLIAGGGVDGPEAVAALLARGASAVLVGTLLLGAVEAGTTRVHRRALGAGAVYGHTAVTRAFTGRAGRAVRNDFVACHDDRAPALYPEVAHLTAPIRSAAAAGRRTDLANLWAGTGYRAVREATAAAIVARLAPTGV
jgi:nitronate monooxygenase